jgi:hypothetical protein
LRKDSKPRRLLGKLVFPLCNPLRFFSRASQLGSLRLRLPLPKNPICERRELKLERARMEKLAIEERLKAEAAAREAGVSALASVHDVQSAAVLSSPRWSSHYVTLFVFSLAPGRSEPSWLAREKKRRGLHNGKTSEEMTRLRRTERRELIRH